MKSIDQVPIGSIVTETIEKYDAVVTGCQIHINGCHRVCLQERRFKDGKPVARTSTDIQNVTVKKENKGGYVVRDNAASDVIGLRAKDAASGASGVITVVEIGPKGNRWFHIQPKREKGEAQEPVWVDEGLVEMIDKPRPRSWAAAGTGAQNCGPMTR